MNMIRSVSDAIDILREIETAGDLYVEGEAEIHKFPFGLWFRGHSRRIEDPEPRVYRRRLSEVERAIVPIDDSGDGEGGWEETNVYDHLRLRVPAHEHTCHSAFDWLCLMQHYSVPTRLLDWSESILPALYFATKNDQDQDGEVIVLNAYRLNVLSKGRTTIATPDDHHVVVRAEMATTRSAKRLRAKENVHAALRRATEEDRNDPNWTSFLKPIAVFPRRLNERMTLQSSVFTIHGGKHYVSATRSRYENDTDVIPRPVSLGTINDSSPDRPILKRYVIPQDLKGDIRRELFMIGIHEATLFPEVDRQAVYLQDCWWYPGKDTSSLP